MKLIVFAFALVAITTATILPCPVEKGPMPKSVTIQSCDPTERCDFVRGRSFKADVLFTACKFSIINSRIN